MEWEDVLKTPSSTSKESSPTEDSRNESSACESTIDDCNKGPSSYADDDLSIAFSRFNGNTMYLCTYVEEHVTVTQD